MARKTDDTALSVDTAISLVLDAEQQALAQIEDCEKRADRIMRDTRQTIRGAVRRIEERIGRLRTACALRNQELVAELDRAAAEQRVRPDMDTASEARLIAVVDATARQLTTLGPDDVD